MQQPLSLILNPLNGTKKSSRFFLLAIFKGTKTHIQALIRCLSHDRSNTRTGKANSLKKPDPGGLSRQTAGTEIAFGRAFYLDLYGWLGIAPRGATVGWSNQPVDREISPPGSASKADLFFFCRPLHKQREDTSPDRVYLSACHVAKLASFSICRGNKLARKKKLPRLSGAAFKFFNSYYQRRGTRTPVTLRSSVVTTLSSVPAGTSTSPPLMKAPPARPIGPSTR